MTATLSPELSNLLASIKDADWDMKLIKQAIFLYAEDGRRFSMNDFRDLMPAMAWGVAGRAFLSLLFQKDSPIREVDHVRSTSPDTHRKWIGVYVLTDAGQQQAGQWRQQWNTTRTGAAA